jgi:hypothetical protein
MRMRKRKVFISLGDQSSINEPQQRNADNEIELDREHEHGCIERYVRREGEGGGGEERDGSVYMSHPLLV